MTRHRQTQYHSYNSNPIPPVHNAVSNDTYIKYTELCGQVC